MNGRPTAATILGAGDSFWMPPRGSTGAAKVDWNFYFVFYVSFFFFLLIVGLMIWFVIRYRRREGVPPAASPSKNLPLELVWTGVPVLLVGAMFYRGMKGMVDLVTPPAGAYQIDVSAQRWKWLFQYANGHVDEDLHVPLDSPVLLVMTSQDVIHSFYVPAFRIKQDVVPGRRTKTWFRATQPGEYLLFCAEYCGTGHSDMTARVVVHPAGEYRLWLENAARLEAQLSPVEAGRRLYQIRACAQCHSVDGRAGIGPTFQNLFGHRQKLRDGSEVLVDENYVRESILDPGAKVVAGYDAVMSTYQGRLTEDDITNIIHYLQSLSESKDTTSQPGG